MQSLRCVFLAAANDGDGGKGVAQKWNGLQQRLHAIQQLCRGVGTEKRHEANVVYTIYLHTGSATPAAQGAWKKRTFLVAAMVGRGSLDDLQNWIVAVGLNDDEPACVLRAVLDGQGRVARVMQHPAQDGHIKGAFRQIRGLQYVAK